MWAQISYDVSKIIEKYVNKDSIGIDIILGGIFVDNILIQIHFFFSWGQFDSTFYNNASNQNAFFSNASIIIIFI